MPKQEFSLPQWEPFLTNHPGRGTLRVQVSTAEGTFPVAKAQVEVSVRVQGVAVLLYRQESDESGIVQGLVLPAMPLSASQNPNTAASSATVYRVTIRHPSFTAILDRPVDIYDTIETILPADLEPLMAEEGM